MECFSVAFSTSFLGSMRRASEIERCGQWDEYGSCVLPLRDVGPYIQRYVQHDMPVYLWCDAEWSVWLEALRTQLILSLLYTLFMCVASFMYIVHSIACIFGLNVWWWPRLCVSATTSSTLERKSKIYICENGEELDVLFWVEIMFTARCIECKHKARMAVLCVCGGALHGFAFTCIIDDDLCFWPWFMQEFEFEIRWCSLGSFCRIDYLESLRFVFSLNEQKSCKKENFSAWKLNHTLVVMFCQTIYFARKIFCVLHRFLRSNECASTVAAPLISRR